MSITLYFYNKLILNINILLLLFNNSFYLNKLIVLNLIF